MTRFHRGVLQNYQKSQYYLMPKPPPQLLLVEDLYTKKIYIIVKSVVYSFRLKSKSYFKYSVHNILYLYFKHIHLVQFSLLLLLS